MHYSSREPTGDISTAPLKLTETQRQPERGLGVGFGRAVLRGGAARARGPKPTRSRRSGAGVAGPETFRDAATGSDGKDTVLTGTRGGAPLRRCWQDAP